MNNENKDLMTYAEYVWREPEELKLSDLKPEVECGPLMHDPTRADWYNYCPVCGEKL